MYVQESHVTLNHLSIREGGSKVLLFSVLAIIGGAYLTGIGSFLYLLGNYSVLIKLWPAIMASSVFWSVFAISIIYIGWRWWQKGEEFTWTERILQVLITILSTFSIYGIFLFTAGDLHDTEVWNGTVKSSSYYEGWTERVETTVCADSNKDGSCKRYETKVSYVDHQPYWQIHTTNGEDIHIKAENYRNLRRHFGNEKFEFIIHPNQSSVGDGNAYHTEWNGSEQLAIPTAVEHPYVNYLKAAKNSILYPSLASETGYEELLLSYPRVQSSNWGEIELNRVMVAGSRVPQEWIKALDQQLDMIASKLGHAKQMNVLVYVVNTKDRAFLYALESHWTKGKKNDVIVIIGVTDFPKVEWASVMAWTENELFKVQLRDRIEGLKDIQEATVVSNVIADQIGKTPSDGGFERMPMKKLEYLIYDIKVPFWTILVVTIIVLIISISTSCIMENNNVRS